MSLKLKLRPAKIFEILSLAREHQLPADPCYKPLKVRQYYQNKNIYINFNF